MEDNIFEKIAVKGMFEQYGFCSDLASNGQEAIDMVKRRIESRGKQPMYQLIMIDYKMPQMSGAKAVKKIL